MCPGVLAGVMGRGLSGLEIVADEDRASRLAKVYIRHAPSAGRLAYLLTGDADLAEDLAQEAFVRLVGRFGFLRDEAVIAAYLRRSIANLARKHWGKRGTERRYLRREGPRIVTQATTLPDLALRDELWQAMAKLPHRQRAAIVLRFYEDLSERQTAFVLGCAVGTVKSAVSRGLARMREEMIGDEGVRA
jgi:RNA polymerase sigma-70 factor (sigma-E family)